MKAHAPSNEKIAMIAGYGPRQDPARLRRPAGPYDLAGASAAAADNKRGGLSRQRSQRRHAALMLLIPVVATWIMASPTPAAAQAIRDGRLLVEGKPFIVLGGELHNSSATSPAYMAPVWDRLERIGVNTVLANVGWDQIEPTSGRFDFAVVDSLLVQARAHDMRLVILWFGAFKNAKSTYAPGWIRADRATYPRAQTRGTGLKRWELDLNPPPVLSVFSADLLRADARAFAALMAHIAATDHDQRVIMVQVENEVGLLGDSRDRSPTAEAAWRRPVPRALVALLSEQRAPPALSALWSARGRRKEGDWPTLFGDGAAADELFMAWSFATYVEGVARAGRAVTSIPFYANAWLGPTPGQPSPGDYPSGGPVAGMIEIWKAAAPSLSLVAPDVYLDDAKAAQADFARPGNPLFIPEERFRPGSLFWALGRHRAIGMGIYDIDHARPDGQLAATFHALRPMARLIAAAQAEHRIAAVLIEGDETQTVELAGTTISIQGADAVWRKRSLDTGASVPPARKPSPSESLVGDVPQDERPFGLVIAIAPERFLFVGQGFLASFSRQGRPVEIDRVEEGRFEENARWVPGRWLGGDDYGQIVPRDMIGASEVRLLP